MSNRHEKVCKVLNYVDHILILTSGFVYISAFASLISIPIGIASSTIGSKICVITAGIKKV